MSSHLTSVPDVALNRLQTAQEPPKVLRALAIIGQFLQAQAQPNTHSLTLMSIRGFPEALAGRRLLQKQRDSLWVDRYKWVQGSFGDTPLWDIL
jgi:hypothetical protein